MVKYIAVLGCLLLPIQAVAACHFTTPTPIVCWGPQGAQNAAFGYTYYRDKVYEDYTQSYLKKAYCVAGPDIVGEIKEIGRGRFATPDGWVDEIVIRMGFLEFFTAAAYIEGTCAPFKPS